MALLFIRTPCNRFCERLIAKVHKDLLRLKGVYTFLSAFLSKGLTFSWFPSGNGFFRNLGVNLVTGSGGEKIVEREEEGRIAPREP
jgi:hypothetical protein